MKTTTFLKSTMILTIATLLSKVLGSLFRIPLQNIAGDEVLGIFTLVYPVYMVILILSVAGIPLAISKLIAEERASNQMMNIRRIYVTASLLGLLFGLVSFGSIVVFSEPISLLLGGKDTYPALVLVSVSLIFAPYMAVYRGYFQGFSDMNPTAYSQVIEQLVRAVFVIALAYVLSSQGFSNSWTAGGVMAGSICGVLASLLYLRVIYVRSPYTIRQNISYSFSTFIIWSRSILRISIPIAIGTLSMALLNFVDSLTVPSSLNHKLTDPDLSIPYLYGIYGRGLSLVQIATVFATSIILPLIPLLTSKMKENDRRGMLETIEQTSKMTHLIAWPAAMGLVFLAVPMNVALFTDAEGSFIIAILGASSIFTSFTIVGTGILQGIDRVRQAAWIIITGVLLKILLNVWLVNWIGIEGAAFSTLIVYIYLTLGNGIFIFRQIPFTVLDRSHIKIISASLLMGAVIGFPPFIYSMEYWGRPFSFVYVVSAIIVGALIYGAALYFTKAVDRQLLQQLPFAGKYIK
ncbi:polysaccharide biosynthesis protein [Halobacillus yeomjeoni]|uniref:putative polysaccharide biosynthesis protein n=1 Tax=Halobacillus yeomjeoni TaxID=311194 RepID=UPI001CD3006D|nr:polysaccharide biosynthesis protein [Halobacillus yeomjeoni]MCA0985205.1 polysaccharide biosynthesis protein [Halobacillus yeomjeoni]